MRNKSPLRPALTAGLASLLIVAAGYGLAGPERVAFPKGYQTWIKYTVVERPDRKIVRNMYVNPEAHARAKAGEPIPDGTVLVMEDMKVDLSATGTPEIGPDGRFVPTGEVVGLFVMEKQKGWGEAIPADKRNGDWDYSSFAVDGTVRPNLNTSGCFSCHLSRTGERDFTFTYAKVLLDTAKR